MIMQKVLTSEEMREVDRLTTEKYGIPSILLMENAAHATANIIKKKLGGSVKEKSFLILCGKGNNGGDGAALARILCTKGAEIYVYLFGKIDDTKGDAKTNFEIIKKIAGTGKLFFEENVHIDYWVHTIGFELYEYDVLVDGLFGTGLTRPLDLAYRNLTNCYGYYKESEKPIFLSLDLPSGLYSNSENLIGDNFRSDLTVSFTAPKLANVLPPATNFNGELYIANIGSPQELIDDCKSKTYLTEKEDAKNWVKQTNFSEDSYKNKRGNALLIVGSKNYTGAAVLVGDAAMVTGVGLVTIATSESAQESVSTRVLPEVITQSLAETENGAISEKAFEKIKNLSEKSDVLAIGSGLSSDEKTTKELVKKVVENRTKPIVIDADGLNSLSPFNLEGSYDLPLILTPHEGEFLRLLGTKDKDAIKDRVKAVREFAENHKVILVLKGERTLIGEPNGKVVINPTGNSGLGKAGNGDNLTGIITGFIAQTLAADHIRNAIENKTLTIIEKIFESVVAAVYIAGLAADIAEEKFGKRTMLASNVRESLAEAFKNLEQLDS